MKNLLKYILLPSLLLVFMTACNTGEEIDVNYTPKVYANASSLEVTITDATDNAFNVNFTAAEEGVVYYALQLSDDSAPDAESIIRRDSGSMLNEKADLTEAVTFTREVTEAIYGAYDYTVYAVMTSVDGVPGNVVMANVVTPDTMDPEFLRDASSPAFETGDNNPFGDVSLMFSEPVFYQGGDITFTGYFTGRTIVVNDPAALTMGALSQTITEHGTFAQDDFMIVSWDEGTFKDNSGKSVAALTGFNYYFKTRLFTLAEQAYLMQGNYNYETVFWGALEGFYNGLYTNPALDFPESTGEIELVLDPEDAEGTTLLGFNLFKGFASIGEPEFLKLKVSTDGELAEIDNQASAITAGEPTEWGHWSFFGTMYPGFWDFDAGTIEHWNTLYGADSGSAIDDIDYNYTRIGTWDKKKSTSLQELKAKSAKRKQDILNGKSKEYKNAVLAY
ncbi:hypothetical protein SAMN05444411_103115 [Lutibacter oricola]|uniref:Uncharacterized protein n=1 Tax=Lutibacter oricola TaxID=762486 RepID=A0A1H2Z240_9FLAO|nr:hypothetical protein [Lutibacter oricola]SDX10974.1 hypothetical protein SAMN05444411_103115 [Lutibacter oricola]